jgi:hypothetical protein
VPSDRLDYYRGHRAESEALREEQSPPEGSQRAYGFSADEVNTRYDSDWDPMSNGGTYSPPHSVDGCLEDRTTSFHKDRLNWIPASQDYAATLASDQNITLERLATPASTSGYIMAHRVLGRWNRSYLPPSRTRRRSNKSGTTAKRAPATTRHLIAPEATDGPSFPPASGSSGPVYSG